MARARNRKQKENGTDRVKPDPAQFSHHITPDYSFKGHPPESPPTTPHRRSAVWDGRRRPTGRTEETFPRPPERPKETGNRNKMFQVNFLSRAPTAFASLYSASSVGG
ncbi:hypothetical protein H6P81_004170 [Aristolochia fimbriata]|uniref:Uncharacterized protein n=1 Tax=Aristolochia fimbriata TaxID=158543 RepID=A0AAV7FHT7_ARIFI|nr:hypothetical protein H6P81_004170 [Aristolochia fimbriata]